MKKMKNALVLSILLSGAAWTGVTMTQRMKNPMVAALIEGLKEEKAKLQRQVTDWRIECGKKPLWQQTFCKGAQVSTRLTAINMINLAINQGKKFGEKAVSMLESAIEMAQKHTK